MKKLTLIFCFICIVFSGISQNSSSDSLKSVFAANITQQSELVNVFYDALNDKFVIENNTKQPHNFNFGIYNITGTLIKEIQCEIQNGKNFDVPIELNSGLYIINISDKSLSITKKFIIR